MLSDEEVLAYFDGQNLSERARTYVLESRATAPTRQVGRGAESSVSGLLYSEISQATRCFESREELAWLRRLERKSDCVLEYHCQPAKIDIYQHDRRGRRQYRAYTPDILVLERDRTYIVDVKPTDRLQKLLVENPRDWAQEGEVFRFLPAEAHFHEIGLEFKIAVAEEVTRLEARNHTLLHQVRYGIQEPNVALISSITSKLSRHTYLTMEQVRQEAGQSGFEAVLWLIDRGIIFADLKGQSLVDDCSIVAATVDLLESAISHLHGKHPQDFKSVPAAVFGNRKAVEHYANRAGIEMASGRSARRARQKLAAADPGQSRAEILMPKFYLRGNRSPKVAPEVQEVLRGFLEELPNKPVSTKNAAYNDYKLAAREKHPQYEPITKKTFLKRYSELDDVHLARKHGGRRAANQAKKSSPVDKRHARAQRPLERVVMDHTMMSGYIEVGVSEIARLLLRPWLTVVTDEATNYMLLFLLSLKQPSRRVFALVFRHLAREFRRLPEELHSDGGKDMNSVFTRQLSAEYGFTYSTSPAANSRWNGLAESVFASIQSSFVKDYPAQCINWSSRSVSRKFKPTDKVCDDLRGLYRKFEEHRQEHNHRISGDQRVSRELQFQRLRAQFPMSGKPVEINDQFFLATSVDCTADYTISQRGTIQKLDRHYAAEFGQAPFIGRKKEVREDPENPYRIYVFSGDEWQVALAPGYDRFEGLSEEQKQIKANEQLEGAEARKHLHEVASERKHKALAEIAIEEKKRLEIRKGRTASSMLPIDDFRSRSAGLFDGLALGVRKFDEQDD